MGKKKEQSPKFGAPLYCASWPAGDFVLVAGGGGKKSSGIPNKIAIVQVAEGQLGEEVASVRTEEAPLRMALHPQGTSLVLALGTGMVQRFDVQSSPGAPPVLHQAKDKDRLAHFTSVKCLAFSSDGRMLALGGEDGAITVVDWLTLRVVSDMRGQNGLRDAVKDLDFSPAHKDKVLAATCEDGSCSLWAWEQQLQIAILDLPQGLEKGGAFNRCRFARDGSRGLFVTVNQRGEAHILHWEQNEEGELLLERQAKAHASASTAFDISRSGAYLGSATSEGDTSVFSSATLAPVSQTRAAHMVFATAVAFDPAERALVSVSADASAHLTPIAAQRRGISSVTLFLLLLVLLLMVVAVFWALGLDVRLQHALERFGNRPGKHGEL
ncbi:probable prolactin regulatory element-binding protein [Coccomyxa sp. Obi]|nr:probable prolactin regulatory element-binding protein [Coccomyxa sp. Obi]